jgi:hypothetical protein
MKDLFTQKVSSDTLKAIAIAESIAIVYIFTFVYFVF